MSHAVALNLVQYVHVFTKKCTSVLQREYHRTGKEGMMMHAILPRSGLTAQVGAIVLQGNHHWIETESTIAAETDCMVMMSGETGHARKVQAERRMITMIEAEKEKRTGERGGD